MTEGKLVFLPKGYRVVPEDPTLEMQKEAEWGDPVSWIYRAMILASPPIDTPPMLRWERGDLFFYKKWMATVFKRSGKWAYSFNTELRTRGVLFDTEQEARRAAEKALGFPEWLVVDEID
jgi:hypothetical protein